MGPPDLIVWVFFDRKTNSNLIWRLQRSVCVMISSVLCTTFTSALEIILGLFPLGLFCRGVATKINKHLWATGELHESDTEGNWNYRLQ